jgi:hypothetical protein
MSNNGIIVLDAFTTTRFRKVDARQVPPHAGVDPDAVPDFDPTTQRHRGMIDLNSGRSRGNQQASAADP